MISVGGTSSKDSIEFKSRKYKIKFKTVDDSQIKVWLTKNKDVKIQGFFRKMLDIPILRAVALIYLNGKVVYVGIFLWFILEFILRMGIVTVDMSSTNSKMGYFVGTVAFWLFNLRHLINAIKGYKSFRKYHGAEHKVILTYYSKQEMNYENCKKAPRIGDDCGSMFIVILLLVVGIGILINLLFTIPIYKSIQFLIGMLISGEIFLTDRRNKILYPIFKIGYFFQEKFLTTEPDDFKLMAAIKAFTILEKAENGELPQEEMEILLSKDGALVNSISN